MATSTAICLDPDPIVFKILTTANLANRNIHHLKPESLGLGIDGHPSMNHYDSTIDHSSKIGIHLSTVQSLLDMLGSSTDYGTDHQSFKRAEAYLRETFKEPFSGNTQTFNSSLNPQSNKKIMSIGKESTGKPCLIKLIESWRFRDTTIASEPFYGLDARKDPSLLKLSAAPTLTWLPPGRSLWRTLRYSERKSSSEEISTEEFTYINRKIHITMHILASPNRHPPPPLFQSGVPNQSPAVGSTVAIKSHYSAVTYEVMLRIGNSPCTAEFYRKSVCFSTSWRPLIEIFVEQFKRTMSMEGRVCLADVANPGVINAAVATSTGQVPNINRAGPFAPISTGNSAIPMGPSVTSYQISSTNSAIPGATQRATLPIYYNGSNNPPPLVSNAAPGGSTINPNPMMQGRGTVIQAPSSSIMFAPNMNPNINIKLQQSGGTTINLNPNHSIIPTKNINFIPGIQAGQVTRRGKSITKQQKEIKASHRTINNTPPAT